MKSKSSCTLRVKPIRTQRHTITPPPPLILRHRDDDKSRVHLSDHRVARKSEEAHLRISVEALLGRTPQARSQHWYYIIIIYRRLFLLALLFSRYFRFGVFKNPCWAGGPTRYQQCFLGKNASFFYINLTSRKNYPFFEIFGPLERLLLELYTVVCFHNAPRPGCFHDLAPKSGDLLPSKAA